MGSNRTTMRVTSLTVSTIHMSAYLPEGAFSFIVLYHKCATATFIVSSLTLGGCQMPAASAWTELFTKVIGQHKCQSRGQSLDLCFSPRQGRSDNGKSGKTNSKLSSSLSIMKVIPRSRCRHRNGRWRKSKGNRILSNYTTADHRAVLSLSYQPYTELHRPHQQ